MNTIKAWVAKAAKQPMVLTETMLDFASQYNISPQTEHFPMSRINDAFARVASGKARYRIVLDADF